MFLTLRIRIQNHVVEPRRLLARPGQQSRTEVEADTAVIVDYPGDTGLIIQNARRSIRSVALGRDSLVPVVIRIGGILQLDCFEPGILSRRLVEVAVNT